MNSIHFTMLLAHSSYIHRCGSIWSAGYLHLPEVWPNVPARLQIRCRARRCFGCAGLSWAGPAVSRHIQLHSAFCRLLISWSHDLCRLHLLQKGLILCWRDILCRAHVLCTCRALRRCPVLVWLLSRAVSFQLCWTSSRTICCPICISSVCDGELQSLHVLHLEHNSNVNVSSCLLHVGGASLHSLLRD